MILVDGVYPDLPMPDTSYFYVNNPMEDLPPMGEFHD